MNSVLGVITNGIAEGRKMSPESVSRVFDDAIMSGPEATAASIIDECAYRDELPTIFRKKLQDGVLARRAQRVQAAREWRSSMDSLVSAWKNEDGAEFARWRDGANIVGIDSLLTAVRFAVAYGCPKDDDLRAHRVLKAERRALKAHLAWLDTRPWEAIARKERSKFELLHGLGHSSSIVELERRLCVEAINALENISEDILALSELAKERDGKVEFSDSKRIIRWTRAVLRAKSFAARMVGSTTESQDAKNDATVGEEAASTAADAVLHGDDKLGPCEPRMFLLHQEGDPAIPCEVGGIGHVDYCEPSKNSDSFKDRLRYQSFSDYMQLVSMEQRAGQWRGGFARPTARAQRLVTLEGLSRTEYIGGVVDAAECAQLFVLADHRNPFLQPWRMHSRRTAPTVAVINVDGAISDETSEDVRSHIRRASKDPRIQGIVMRIDSPGGSASASDLISRAVEVCTNKPIVASMSNVCASGGLFIAVPCERIFAEEATITGSCGVIFSGFLPIGLFERLGITVDSVESSKFSKYFGGAGNVTQWDAEYRGKIDNLIDDMYTSFVEAVSRGRGMSFNEVETIARGRVWSGIDAKRIGMIDEFGGLDDAAAYVAEKVGAEPGIPPRLVNYPTTGMKLEDQLRRVGVIRSHRDEEGDEEAPRETKNKRRRTVASLLDLGDDGEDEDESEERDVRTNEKGGHASSGKKEDEAAGDGSSDHEGMGNEDEDPSSITDLLLQSRVSSPESADGVGSLTPKTMLSLFLQSPRALLGVVAETLADVQDDLVSSCALWCLKRLDSYLIDASPSSSVSIAADYLLNTVLARNGVGVAVAAELKAAAATSGRPAMIMSPQIHVMDGPNPK
jgi:signal peptide peptidase SppA